MAASKSPFVSLWLIVISTSIALFLFVIQVVGGFTSWHLKLSNFLYTYSDSQHTGDVVVVKIDDKSLRPTSDGGLGRWQNWRRSYFAQVIRNLDSAGAKVIGVDVLFTEPSNEGIKDLLTNPIDAKKVEEELLQDDKNLHLAIEQHDAVVLAAKVGTPNLVPISAIFPSADTHTTLGDVNIPYDTDATVRSVPLLIKDTTIERSFSLEIVRRFLELSPQDLVHTQGQLTILKQKIKLLSSGKNYGTIEVPTTDEHLYTNFFGPPLSIPTLSFIDVYTNNFQKEQVKNKIVLLGEMNAGLHDEVTTPVSFGTPMPGVELHANAIETLLKNKGLFSVPLIWNAILLFALSVFSAFLYYRLRPWVGSLLLCCGILGYTFFALWVFQRYDMVLNMLFPPTALLLTFVAITVYKYISEEKTKNQITEAFSHYVSDKVVKKIVDHPSVLSLGGEKKMMSVSFTDIAGFTSISEKSTPEKVVAFLQIYLESMTNIILKQEGTLDKYIGDAIMAFWGAPIDLQDHALLSCRSALLMHKEMKTLNTASETKEVFNGVGIRTGIASGDMVVGNIGSQKRFDYTVIGDTVNLASRLEGVNKVYGTEICVSEATKNLAGGEFVFRVLDRIKVKGKNRPIQIYELLEEKALASENLLTYVKNFEEMYHLYLQRDFYAANEKILVLELSYPEDSVLKLYKERIKEYIASAPEKDWDGVVEMKTK